MRTRVLTWTGMIILVQSAGVLAAVRPAHPVVDVSVPLSSDRFSAEWTIVNDGSRPVTVTKTTTACGCERVDWGTTPIEPGESRTVRMHGGLGGATGLIKKRVILETDSPDTPTVLLQANVAIPVILKLSEPYVRWNQGDEPCARTVQVEVSRQVRASLIGVRSWHDKVQATLKVVEPGRRYEVTVRLLDTADTLDTGVELLTDCTEDGLPLKRKVWLLVHVRPRDGR